MDFAEKTAISTRASSGMGLLFAQNFTEFGGRNAAARWCC